MPHDGELYGGAPRSARKEIGRRELRARALSMVSMGRNQGVRIRLNIG